MSRSPLPPRIPRPGLVVQAVAARVRPPAIGEGEAAVLACYGLAPAGPPRNLPTGWRNRVVVVSTSAGDKVLRRYRPGWPEPTIQHEHAVLARLAEVGFPAPRLVRTAGGGTLAAAGGEVYALFERMPGVSYAGSLLARRGRLALLARAGETLARLHAALADFTPEGRHHLGFTAHEGGHSRHDLDWYAGVLRALPGQAQSISAPAEARRAHWLAERSDWLLEQIARLDERLGAAALPRTVIHGDYGLHNLLFQRDGTAAPLDFELARLEWRATDLAAVLARLDEAGRRAFLHAYEAVTPLGADERRLLADVSALRLLQGAVRYWHTYREQGGEHRLAAAEQRIRQAADPALHADLRALAAPALPRVVMVSRLFHPWVGGTERQALKQAKALRARGASVEIVTGWWFRGTPRREVIEGVPVTRNHTLWEFFGLKGLRKFGGYTYLLTLIGYLVHRRRHYDVIHVHGLNYHTFASVIAGRWAGRPVVAKIANSGPGSDVLKMREDRQLALARFMLPTALRCDRFIALNPRIVAELEAEGVPRGRIVELPNGVEMDGAPRRAYTLHDPARLLYVGRLHPQKGLETLLEAARQLGDPGAGGVHLRLVGDGPERPALERLAAQIGLAGRVEFAGEREDIPAQLAWADVFILPSLAEGISNALLEAMATGLPVIASSIPGNADVVEPGRTGLLFPPGDAAALAAALATLIGDEPLRRRLGMEARRLVGSRYSLNALAEHLLDLYHNLLVEGRAPGAQQVPALRRRNERARPTQG